ncbi:MAG: arginine--tRNA ligase [Candidatus Andersenbacteria bacterium]|nr:arginine--tRNA ligase [Candidatus Andersenbacteria bacterium]
MLNLARELQKNIQTALEAAIKAGKLPAVKELPKVVVRPMQEEGHGDYASPFAMQLTGLMKKKPLDIVEVVAAHMEKPEYVGKLEAAAPGFLNVWLSPGYLTSRLDDVVQASDICDMGVGMGKSANLEFISANPTGPLTLGNARTVFSADTLANVLACAGYNVTREYYINDAGLQIRRLGESVLRRALQAQGEPHSAGAPRGKQVEFAEDLYQGQYIYEIAQEVAEALKENEGKEFTVEDVENPEVIAAVSKQALSKMLAAIKKTVKEDLKIDFNVWTSEAALRESGAIEDVLKKLKATKSTFEKDGALWLKAEATGEEKDKVLVKGSGEYAYIMPDIAYHQNKFDRKYDLIFSFFGADHQGQVPVLSAAMNILGNDTNKLKFVISQWLALSKDGKEFKPSKRRGEVYGPQDLIAEIGYDAARYFMVQHSLSSHMTLDLDLAKEKSERNPVYYVQYAYVRLQSILRRAKEEGVISELGHNFDLSSSPALTQTAEVNLMKAMYMWPEVITSIAQEFTVHQLPYYAYHLAKAVHVFYNHVPVLVTEDETVKMGRLQLVLAARVVLSKVLDLLGISKPEVM